MHDTKLTFQSRCDEIQYYISFIKAVEPDRAALCKVARSIETKEEDDKFFFQLADNSPPEIINNEIKKILKANVYLLLYNLVESTVRNTIEAIYSHLNNKAVCFHDVRDELKLEILKNLRKHMNKSKIETFSDQVNNITQDVIYLTFNSEDRFNGNVDARFIRNQVEKMGFQIVADAVTRDGADLLSIKDLRNSLAHGSISFSDCGKDLTVNELEAMCDRTQKYLAAFIDCTEKYLNEDAYKKVA